MQVSRPIVVLAASAVFAIAPLASCAGAANSGGSLPPIRTTTTLSASETTISPYYEVYRLKAGEHLGTVASLFNVPVNEIIKANAETLGNNPSNLPVGTEILIPPHRYIETLPPTTTTTLPE